MRNFGAKRAVLLVTMATALGVSACEGGVTKTPREVEGEWVFGEVEERETIFGKGGLGAQLFGGPGRNSDSEGGGGLNVNAYLWRASLDTVAFMPLASADPFGGVIITDWYSPNASPDERFKVNLYILGRALRADGVKASVFRQVRGSDGTWRDAPVAETVATDLENAVLTRARQLRMAAANP